MFGELTTVSYTLRHWPTPRPLEPMAESTDTNGPVWSGCVSTLGWATAERRRVCSSLIIRIAVLSTASASITAISSQNSQADQRWCSTICQLFPRGQQRARTH